MRSSKCEKTWRVWKIKLIQNIKTCRLKLFKLIRDYIFYCNFWLIFLWEGRKVHVLFILEHFWESLRVTRWLKSFPLYLGAYKSRFDSIKSLIGIPLLWKQLPSQIFLMRLWLQRFTTHSVAVNNQNHKFLSPNSLNWFTILVNLENRLENNAFRLQSKFNSCQAHSPVLKLNS